MYGRSAETKRGYEMKNDYYGIYIEGFFQPQDITYISAWVKCCVTNNIKINKISVLDGKVNITFHPAVAGELENEN